MKAPITFSLEVQTMPTKPSSPPAKQPRVEWALWGWGELLAAVDHGLPGADAAARRRINGAWEDLKDRMRDDLAQSRALLKRRGAR